MTVGLWGVWSILAGVTLGTCTLCVLVHYLLKRVQPLTDFGFFTFVCSAMLAGSALFELVRVTFLRTCEPSLAESLTGWADRLLLAGAMGAWFLYMVDVFRGKRKSTAFEESPECPNCGEGGANG